MARIKLTADYLHKNEGAVVAIGKFGNVGSEYRGHCSCGYRGPIRSSSMEARTDVMLHLKNDVGANDRLYVIKLHGGRAWSGLHGRLGGLVTDFDLLLCNVCQMPTSQDWADLSRIRFRVLLCQHHYEERKLAVGHP